MSSFENGCHRNSGLAQPRIDKTTLLGDCRAMSPGAAVLIADEVVVAEHSLRVCRCEQNRSMRKGNGRNGP